MRLRWKKVIWLLLTNKFFRWTLLETIKYAVNTHEEIRGNGAADVLVFNKFFYAKIIEVQNEISN